MSSSSSTIFVGDRPSSLRLAASLYARAPVGVGGSRSTPFQSSVVSACSMQARPAATASSVSNVTFAGAIRGAALGLTSIRFGTLTMRGAGSPGVTVATRPSTMPERLGTGSTNPFLKTGVAA